RRRRPRHVVPAADLRFRDGAGRWQEAGRGKLGGGRSRPEGDLGLSRRVVRSPPTGRPARAGQVGVSAMTHVLEIDEITAGYLGNVDVLHGVSLHVSAGEAVAILGANGAGKTTLLKTVCGALPARSGSVRFQGEQINGEPPHKVARDGVGHVPEGRQIFVGQTGAENLELGAMNSDDPDEPREQLLDVFPVLREKLDQNAGELSGGQQQMLAIARGLMSSPALLMIDEPSLGLSPKLIDELTDLLRRLRSDLGIAILLVEQNAAVAAGVADRAYVLRLGNFVLEEKAGDVLGNDEVLKAYLA